MSDWHQAVASNIKALKDAHNWSQEILAEKAECSKSVIRDLETGKGSASVDMLEKIARAFRIDVSDLLSPKNNVVTMVNEPVSKVLKRLALIPDRVYELAIDLGDDKEAWDTIEGIMETKGEEIKARTNKAKKA